MKANDEAKPASAVPASDYTICGNTRHVKPYIFEFSTHAKGRWLNRQLLDVVCQEFGGLGYNREFWKNAILDGHIKVNHKTVTEDYVFKNSDYLTRKTHRHEPPVYGQVTVVGENERLFAVSKPASLPMHSCGAYCNNSLSQILIKEFQQHLKGGQLHQIHRLDRVTSGLVVMAKNKTAAREMCDQIQSRHTRKSYFARVQGKFPQNLAKLRDFSQCDKGGEECSATAASMSVQRLVDLVSEDNALVQKANFYKRTASKHDNSNTNTGSKRKREGNAGSEVTLTVPPVPKVADAAEAAEPAERGHEIQIPTGYKYCSAEEIAGYAPLIEQVYRQCNPAGSGDNVTRTPTPVPPTLCVQVPLVTVSHKEGIHAADLSGASCCCFQAAVDKTVEGTENISAGSGCSTSAGSDSGTSTGRAGTTASLLQAKPQYAISLFTAMAYDPVSDTSLVLCSPVTGRTHQLRIHLQVLDNPISNDVCYGGELFAHEEGGKVEAALAAYKLHCERGASNSVSIPHIDALVRKHTVDKGDGVAAAACDSTTVTDTTMTRAGGSHNHDLLNAFTALGNDNCSTEHPGNSSHMQMTGNLNPYLDRRQPGETEEDHIIRTCSYCREADALELHQSMHCDGIYLHAFCYETDTWSFQTPWPEWSNVFKYENTLA